MKLPASGNVERLRQKVSRGKRPLVVAADTGLMSGEGVSPAMIGGPTLQRPKEDAIESSGVVKRAATISKTVQDAKSEAVQTVFLLFGEQSDGKFVQQAVVSVGSRPPANILLEISPPVASGLLNCHLEMRVARMRGRAGAHDSTTRLRQSIWRQIIVQGCEWLRL